MGKRKIVSVLSFLTVAAMISGQALICGCSSKKETKEETSASETTSSMDTSSNQEETTSAPETTSVATELTTTLSETTDAGLETGETAPSENGKDSTPYKEITLDGVKEHHFIADDYCYIESDKFVLFLEKDIEIPGDFVVNVDAIIDELEKELGVSYAPDSYDYAHVIDMRSHYGENPWKGWDIGSKIPVFLYVDRKDEGLISCATGNFAVFVFYEMFTDELWNSVPSFKDNDWRRTDYIDYSTIAHELTHTITSRYVEMSSIMTEGIADYMGMTVIDTLADSYPSIKEVKKKRYLFDYSVPESVNENNAERIFIEDYSAIEHADRGAEYAYGRYLCQFLKSKYGNDFYLQYKNAIVEKKLTYSYGTYDETIMTKYAEALKDTFGEDVFKEFGKWCVSKNYLQE